jgi:hypothetical protein
MENNIINIGRPFYAETEEAFEAASGEMAEIIQMPRGFYEPDKNDPIEALQKLFSRTVEDAKVDEYLEKFGPLNHRCSIEDLISTAVDCILEALDDEEDCERASRIIKLSERFIVKAFDYPGLFEDELSAFDFYFDDLQLSLIAPEAMLADQSRGLFAIQQELSLAKIAKACTEAQNKKEKIT